MNTAIKLSLAPITIGFIFVSSACAQENYYGDNPENYDKDFRNSLYIDNNKNIQKPKPKPQPKPPRYDYKKVYSNKIWAEAGIWRSAISGSMENATSTVDFENDIGYGTNNNITYINLGYNTQSKYNIELGMYTLSETTHNTTQRDFDVLGQSYSAGDTLSTRTDVSTANLLVYKLFETDYIDTGVGANIQHFMLDEEIDTDSQLTQTDFSATIPTLHLSFLADLGSYNSFIKVEINHLSNGANSVKDYKVNLAYNMSKMIQLSIGYKKQEIKAEGDYDDYTFQLSGNYAGVKILF